MKLSEIVGEKKVVELMWLSREVEKRKEYERVLLEKRMGIWEKKEEGGVR